MTRILFLALLGVAIFGLIPGLASSWLQTNGYMESTATHQGPERSLAQPRKQASSVKRSGRAVLAANSRGHYVTKAYINNKPVRVVVDTGATLIALTYEDAKKLGLKPQKSDFNIPVNTANGRAYFAKVKLRRVRIGQAEERDIEATVAPKGALGVTLLGMSYLKKLKRFQIERGKLILES